ARGGEAPVVAAQVAAVGGHAVELRQRDVEGAARATLVAVVVRRVAVDETVGEDEVHRLRGEWLQGAVELLRDGRRGFPGPASGQRTQQHQGQDRSPHCTPPACVVSGLATSSEQKPATARHAPPRTSTRIGSPPNTRPSRKPSVLTATSWGITMKKLKMPMYTPIFSAGRLSDSIAYGRDRIDAQAKPTPTIDSSSHCGSRITANDARPAPP